MKKAAIFTILAIVAFSCAKKPDQKTMVLTLNKYALLVYKRFCFYDGRCTTYSLVEMYEIKDTEEDENTGDKKIYKDVEVVRINPAVASDSAVVNQFILSLEAYNNCFSRENNCAVNPLSMDLYFKNDDFRDEYNFAFDESNYLKIIGLSNDERITSPFGRLLLPLFFTLETVIIST